MKPDRYDAVVVGAGAVGLATALALAQAGFATALVGPPSTRADGRTAALLDSSMRFLAGLGLADAVERAGAPLARMRIVDETASLFRPPPATFAAAEIGLAQFGWNIENDALVRILSGAVRACPAITWREVLSTGYLEAESGIVTLADGGTLQGSLVCAADGRASPLREAAGIPARRYAYRQAALTTILAHARPHGSTSTEFHTRSGPCTLVPLPGDRSSLVWVSEPHHARRLHEAPDAVLLDALAVRTHGALGDARIDGPRGLVPLGRLSVDRLYQGRLVLLGEAAHVLPPIGAQGLNLGMADAETLARLAAEICRPGEDLGRSLLPAAYEKARKTRVALRAGGVDALNRSLLDGKGPLDAIRGLGLGLLGQIGPLRRTAMRVGLT